MISILVPVYNRKFELERLLQSFVKEYTQNRIIFEVIIIDDNSDDGSYEIAEFFVQNNVIFKLLKSGYRSPGKSRNIGAIYASYDWLLYCDSDNLMLDNWSVSLASILNQNMQYDGIWFPSMCNKKILTSKKYLKKGTHEINSFFYFNYYVGEVVHCVKKSFLLTHNYFYLKGTSNDFPDLLWFSLFSDKKYKILFYNQVIQEYYITSANRISADSSNEKNFSQIIHYKLILNKILKSKYICTFYFLKILVKYIFFIIIVDNNKTNLKQEVGILRWFSIISYKIGLSDFFLKKLANKRNKNNEGIIYKSS